MFSVFSLCYCLVVITSAIDFLERLVSEITCCVLCGTLNPTHSTLNLKSTVFSCFCESVVPSGSSSSSAWQCNIVTV